MLFKCGKKPQAPGMLVAAQQLGEDLPTGRPVSRFLPPAGFPGPELSAWGEDDHGLWQTLEVAGVAFTLRWIPPGEFMMGSPPEELQRRDNETLHPVRLTHGYWLAETTVTQALWQAVMGENPSEFKGAQRPVETVSWDDCQQFLGKLDRLQPGLGLGLPTEAQWEYACRAGSRGPFSFGENIDTELANYDGTEPYAGAEKGPWRRETVEVLALPCNDWGLYQMHGNVWEWCADWYGDYPTGLVEDPVGPAKPSGPGARRVLRGGSWIDFARWARSAYRSWRQPDVAVNSGLRLARGQGQQGRRG